MPPSHRSRRRGRRCGRVHRRARRGRRRDLKALEAKQPNGPWKEEVKIDLGSGQIKDLYRKVESTTRRSRALAALAVHEAGALQDEVLPRPAQHHESDVNTYTVTDPSGYAFDASPDKFKKFRLRIEARVGTTPQRCITQCWALETSSSGVTTNVGVNGPCV